MSGILKGTSRTKKKEEKEQEKKESKKSGGILSGTKREKSNEVTAESLGNFINNVNDFFKTAESDYSGIGYGNAKGISSDYGKKRSDLQTEAEPIKNFFTDTMKSVMPETPKTSAGAYITPKFDLPNKENKDKFAVASDWLKYLNDVEKASGEYTKTFDDIANYYSQWATEEEYNVQKADEEKISELYSLTPEEIKVKWEEENNKKNDLYIFDALLKSDVPIDGSENNGADNEQIFEYRKYVADKYGISLENYIDEDGYYDYNAYESALEELAHEYRKDPAVAYTDRNGNTYTWANLYYDAENKVQFSKMEELPELKGWYDENKTYQDDIDKLWGFVQANLPKDPYSRAEYASQGDEYRQRLEEADQFYAYIKDKYGVDFSTFDYDETEKANKLVQQIEGKIDENKTRLGAAGYDYDRMVGYEQFDNARSEYASNMQGYQYIGENYPLISALSTVFTSFASGGEFLIEAGKALKSDSPLTPTTENIDSYVPMNYYGMDATNITQGLQSGISTDIYKDVYDMTGSEILAKVASSSYSGISSALYSRIVISTCYALGGPGVGEALGLFILSSQAAASGMKQAIENGGTNADVFKTGFVQGLNEALFEKLSLDQFIKAKPYWNSKELKETLKVNFKNFMKQSFTEGSEELFTDLANEISDRWINGGASEYETNVAMYIAQGMSESEAREKAGLDFCGQLVESFYGGFIGGGLGSITQTNLNLGLTAADYLLANAENNKQAKKLGADVIKEGGVTQLVNNAREMDNAEISKLADKVSKHPDSNKKVGKLYVKTLEQNVNDYATARNTEIDKAVRAEFKKENINYSKKKADVVNKVLFGEKLTEGETKISKQINAERIANNLKEQNADISRAIEAKMKASSNRVDNVLNILPNEKIKEKVSFDGKTKNKKSLEEISIKEIASINYNEKTGKYEMKFRTENGDLIDSADVLYKDNAEALLYEFALESGMNAAIANEIIKGFDGNGFVSAQNYIAGMLEGMQYGAYGIKAESASKNGFFADLTDVQKNTALRLGQIEGKKNVDSAQKRVDNAKKISKRKGEKGRHGNIDLGNAEYDNLTERQKASVDTLQKLVDDGIIKNNIHFFESETVTVDGKEKRVYKGTETPAPNGYYEPTTGDICIDINAGNNGEGVILMTAAHELTHFIRQWSPAKFKVLADFLMEQYGKNGTDIEATIRKKMTDYGLSYDVAYEEVVADSMQSMFTDGNLAEKLEVLKMNDESLISKMREFIHELQAKINKAYDGADPYTEEGRIIKQMKGEIDRIADLFADALMTAENTYGTAKTVSMKSAVEQTKDLIALHNITSDQLTDALARNGLIIPSVAVTNKGFNSFGEISLLFNKDTIDPSKNDLNKLYGADAWTPTQTTLKKNAQFDRSKVTDTLNNIKEKLGKHSNELFDVTEEQFENAVRDKDGSVFNAYEKNLGVRTAYAIENGLIDEVPTNKDGSIDYKDLENMIKSALASHEAFREYKAWLNNISNSVITSYDEATNTDILNSMKSQPDTAKKFNLSIDGTLTAPAAQYTSIDTARKNRSRIKEDVSAETKAVADGMLSWAEKVSDKTDRSKKTIVNAINESFDDRYNVSDIIDAFEEKNIAINKKLAIELQELYRQAVELPTEYFEAKPGREVSLEEIDTAVVPDNTSTEIIKALQENGITVVEYEAGNKDSRLAAIRSREHLMFSERNDVSAKDNLEVVDGLVVSKSNAELIKKNGITFPQHMNDLYSPRTVDDGRKIFNTSSPTALVTKNSNKYSERNYDSTDNRTLLSNALLTTAQNDIERSKIEEYQKNIENLNAAQNKLSDLRAEIKEMSFAKGKRDTEKLKILRDEATKLANRINIYDKKLLDLESTKALKEVVSREKQKVESRLKTAKNLALKEYREKALRRQQDIIDRYRERIAEGVENRKAKSLRDKVKKQVEDLRKTLMHPTEKKFIPAGLVNAVVKVYELIDTTGKDHTTKAYEKNQSIREALRDLRDQYNDIESFDYNFEGEFSKEFYDQIKLLESEIGDKPIREMDSDQLDDVYTILHDISAMITDARKQIGTDEAITNYQAGQGIIDSMDFAKKSGLAKAEGLDAMLRNWMTNPMRAVREMSAFDHSGRLVKLFEQLDAGRRKADYFRMENTKKFEALRATKEDEKSFNDAVEKANYEVTDVRGNKVMITKMQVMQAILTYEREQGNKNRKHLETPVKFTDAELEVKGKHRQAFDNGHDVMVNEQFVNKAKENLTEWDKRYLNAARLFFQVDSKNAVNEVTLITKHRLIANENNYIPYDVNEDYIASGNTNNAYDSTLANAGMLQSVVQNSKKQLVMRGLNVVTEDHINDVANLYGLSVPIRNFRKAFNMIQTDVDGGRSVTDAIRGTWGQSGKDLIQQAVDDLESPRRQEGFKPFSIVKSAFVTSTLAGNLSVFIKQAASYSTAGAVLSKIALEKAKPNFLRNLSKLYDEIDAHTSQHWIRRQGLSTQELGEMNQSHGWENIINKKLGNFSPMKWIQWMDVQTTAVLWIACKYEIEAKGIKQGDENYWNEVTNLYDKVIEETQPMYDSLHRAEITKNQVAKNFIMFQTQPLQNSGILREASLEYKYKKKIYGKTSQQATEAKTKFLKAVDSQLRSAVVFTAMTLIANLVLHKMNPWRDDDGEITAESVGTNFLLSVGKTMIGVAVPVLGGYGVGVAEKFIGGSRYDVISDPTIDKINDTINLFVKMKDPSWENLKNLAVDVCTYFSVPSGNVVNGIDAIRYHIEDAINGEFFSFEAGYERSNSQNVSRSYTAFLDGDAKKVKNIYEDMKQKYLDDGKTEKEAKSYMRRSVTDFCKDDYLEAYKSNDTAKMLEIRRFMQSTGIYDDVVGTCQDWIKNSRNK